VTLLPDEDPTSTPDPDADPTAPLGVVPNDDRPPALADAAVRDAAIWVTRELERLRKQRAERDRTGLAEIAEMRRRLKEERAATNASIKALVAEQARLARVLRVLDQ
jgi:hypothetical protein